jgi:hypothetical protein
MRQQLFMADRKRRKVTSEFNAVLVALALLGCDNKRRVVWSPPSPVSSETADADLQPPFDEPNTAQSDAGPVPSPLYCHMQLGLCARLTGLTADEYRSARERCIGDSKLDTTPCSEVDLFGTCDHWPLAQGVADKTRMYLSKSSTGIRSMEYARGFCDTGTFIEASNAPAEGDAQAPGTDAGRAHAHP